MIEAIPSSRFEPGFSARGGEGKKELSFQGTLIKMWEMALKFYVMIYPNRERIHREGFTRSLWIFARVALRAGRWQVRISGAAGAEPGRWRMQPEPGLNFCLLTKCSCWVLAESRLTGEQPGTPRLNARVHAQRKRVRRILIYCCVLICRCSRWNVCFKLFRETTWKCLTQLTGFAVEPICCWLTLSPTLVNKEDKQKHLFTS